MLLVACLVTVPGAAAWPGPRAEELPGSLATSSLDPDTRGRNSKHSRSFTVPGGAFNKEKDLVEPFSGHCECWPAGPLEYKRQEGGKEH